MYQHFLTLFKLKRMEIQSTFTESIEFRNSNYVQSVACMYNLLNISEFFVSVLLTQHSPKLT